MIKLTHIEASYIEDLLLARQNDIEENPSDEGDEEETELIGSILYALETAL